MAGEKKETQSFPMRVYSMGQSGSLWSKVELTAMFNKATTSLPVDDHKMEGPVKAFALVVYCIVLYSVVLYCIVT